MKKLLFSITIILSMILTPILSGCGMSDLLNETDGYIVSVVDEDENPVEGASVQLCSDKNCFMEETDSDGMAFFDLAPGKYSVHVLNVPEGYITDADKEYMTSSESMELIITVSTDSAGIVSENIEEEIPEEHDAVEAEEAPEPELPKGSATEILSRYKLDNYVPKNSGNKMNFSTTDLDGNPVDNSIFAENKITVVNYFASWCGPCKQELPYFVSISEDFREDGIGFLGIATMLADDTIGELKEVISEYGINYPVIIMNDELAHFLEGGIPQTLFVDSEGNILDITMEEAVAAMEILDKEQAERYIAGEFESRIETEDDRALFDYYYLYGGWQECLEEDARTSIYKGAWTCSLPKDALLTLLADRYL